MRWLKTIALVAGLLLWAAPASATITTWNHADADSWATAACWDNGVPGANDTAVFDGTGVGLCTLNAAGVCNRLVISNAANTIVIKTGNSLAVGAGGFAFTDGDFVDNACAVTVAGDCRIVTPAALTSTATWTMSGTGNLENATSTNIFKVLAVEGAGTIVATRTGNVYTKKFTLGAADSLKGAFTTYVVADGNDPLTVGAAGITYGGYTNLRIGANRTQAAVTVTEPLYVESDAITDTLTLRGALSAGRLIVGDSVTFKDSGYQVTVSGILTIDDSSTAVISTGTWKQDGSGSAKNATSTNAFSTWRVTNDAAGAITVSRAGNVYCKNLHIGAADTIKGAFSTCILPPGDTFLVDSGGVSKGGVTDIYLAVGGVNRFCPGISISDSVRIHGTAATDTITFTNDWTVGDLVVDTVTIVDSSYDVIVAGDIGVGGGAVLSSSGFYSQTAKGNVTAKASNPFFDYSTSIADTVGIAGVAAADTSTFFGFTVTGTRGSTWLYGRSGAATKFSVPDTASITNTTMANLQYCGAGKLKAYGNIPAGHLTHIAFRR